MRNGILAALGVWAFAAAPLVAQPLPPPFPGELLPEPVNVMPGPQLVNSAPYDPQGYRVWVRGEVLAWWVKNAPMPITVVNDSGASIFSSNTDYGTFAGFRFAMGVWFDPSNNIGIEASIFSTEQRSRNLFAASDANGSPTLAFPFVSQTPGNTGAFLLPITTPGQFDGGIRVGSSLSLWGTEINGVFRLLTGYGFEVTALAGFRYLDLQENLSIRSDAESLADGTFTSFRDGFNTRNQFYGGQLGARFGWQRDRLSFDITGKLALGATHETVDIQGATVQFPGNSITPNVYPGGFFAQPSNIGRSSSNQFAVIPSVELKVAYQLNPRWRVFAGYDFLYWSQVVRPGNQVDHNINLTQSAILGNGALTGPASPTPLFNRSDFWAQGVTVGVEYRF